MEAAGSSKMLVLPTYTAEHPSCENLKSHKEDKNYNINNDNEGKHR
jgi:hypothetical protein